ncbi:MAG: hypothetical protein R6U96_14615 [Promethearchaeia archaeon]
MLEQIAIPEKIREDAKCNCGNRQWTQQNIEINTVQVGGIIIAFEISLGLKCTECGLYSLKLIGTFDNLRNLKHLTTFPYCRELIPELEKYKGHILSSFETLNKQHNGGI